MKITRLGFAILPLMGLAALAHFRGRAIQASTPPAATSHP